jgi:hypothetical protein
MIIYIKWTKFYIGEIKQNHEKNSQYNSSPLKNNFVTFNLGRGVCEIVV